jgi:hypothetical protein
MIRILTMGALALAMLAAACAPQPYVQPTVVAEAPIPAAPVVYAQPAHNNDGLLTGMLMGHMMSGGYGGNRTTVVNRSYSSYRPSYRSSYGSSFRSSGFGRRR